MVKVPIPALLTVLNVFRSDKVFISGPSITCFWNVEETILAPFFED